MNFTTKKHDNYSLVTITTDKLDSIISPELKADFVVINKKGDKNILLDLSAVKYCDSSGLSALLIGNRICTESNGSFIICGIQPMVEKLLKISHLDGILTTTPTLPEAIDFLFMEELERDLGSADFDDEV